LLGASHTLASGVEQEAGFEAILERRLNSNTTSQRADRYEILNFSAGGYVGIDQIDVLENKVLPFAPHAVFYVGHPNDAGRIVFRLARAAPDDVFLTDPFFSDITQRAGVDNQMPFRVRRQRLRPYGKEVWSWVHSRLVEICRKNGIRPVFILLPMIPRVPGPGQETNSTSDVEIAARAGFVVLDLTGVYDQHERRELWVAEWDDHPNALGHRLIADRLYDLIQQKRDLIFGDAEQ
jgi:hypothetical protein